MPPRNSARGKSKPRKSDSSSDSESSPIVKTPSKKKSVKSSSSGDSSPTVKVRYIKSSTKKKVRNGSPIKTNKGKTTPRKIVISSSSDNSSSSETPILIPTKKNTKTNSAIKKLDTSSSDTPIRKNKSGSSNGSVKNKSSSSEDGDLESQINKILPRDLTNIVVSMVGGFEGIKTTFKDTVKTDRILLDGNNIIYFLDDRIVAHNLNNYKTVFNVEHKYDSVNYIGMFKIKNSIIVLQENNNLTLLVGVHDSKGIKISSKIINLPGQINHLLETAEKIIFKIGIRLYVLDPFVEVVELIEINKGDLMLKYNTSVNPMKKWKGGFYITDSYYIYIFDTVKLIKKIAAEGAKCNVDEDDLYYFLRENDNYYMFKYNIADNISKRYDYGKYPMKTNFIVKNGMIFFYGDHTIGSGHYGFETHLLLKLVDLRGGGDFANSTATFIYNQESAEDDQLLFLDFINDKVIYRTIIRNEVETKMYDLLGKKWSRLNIDGNYLGTTSTNKMVFRGDREGLTVLS